MDYVEIVLTEPAMARHEWEHLVVVVVVACCYGDYRMAGLTMTPSTTLVRLLGISANVALRQQSLLVSISAPDQTAGLPGHSRHQPS
jgi:hypothetical protein